MEKKAKIYVAGHRGMVGSAICRELLRQAQRFSVNVYQNVFKQLKGNGAIYSIDDDKLMFLDEKHYHDTLGLCSEAKGQMSFQCDQ